MTGLRIDMTAVEKVEVHNRQRGQEGCRSTASKLKTEAEGDQDGQRRPHPNPPLPACTGQAT